MLVESKALLGSYDSNPFEFQRKWEVQTTDRVFTFNNKLEVENSLLKDSLTFMASQMQQMVANQNRLMSHFDERYESEEISSEDESLSSKRKRVTRSKKTLKGKGLKKTQKRSSPDGQESDPSPPERSSFWTSFLGKKTPLSNPESEQQPIPGPSNQSIREGTPVSFRSCLPDPTPEQEVQLQSLGATKTYWVTKVELELNGSPLDQGQSYKNNLIFLYYFY